MNIRYGDIVVPRTPQDAHAIGNGFKSKITTKTKLTVIIDVRSAITHRGQESGLIVRLPNEVGYPYVWDESRFNLLEES